MLASKLQSSTSAGRPMILVYDTSLGSLTIDLPLGSSGIVNVLVDWGDGSSDFYSTNGAKSHTYASNGVYTVTVVGTLTAFGYTSGGPSTRPELVRCLSFGGLGLTSLYGAFKNCSNLIEVPLEMPSTVFNLNELFIGASSFNQDISSWDTSNIGGMASMFSGATSFNQNIGGWNTSNVTNMSSMFQNATSFNQNIGGWDTSNVTNMNTLFYNATSFNQDLKNWCVGNISLEPANFSLGSALTVSNYPSWGTCPSYVADGSITYIGEATGVDSATLPAHQAGDLMVAFAFRDGSTTLPTQPSGWTSIDTAAANTCSARLAYKVATSGSETSGTWSNATTVIFLIYRGVNIDNITGTDTESTGSSTTVTYNANGYWKGLSRLVAFAGHRSIDTSLGTAPGDLTLIVNPVDATDEAAAFQSTVDNYGNWASTNVSVGGTSSGWITFTLRLRVPIVPA